MRSAELTLYRIKAPRKRGAPGAPGTLWAGLRPVLTPRRARPHQERTLTDGEVAAGTLTAVAVLCRGHVFWLRVAAWI